MSRTLLSSREIGNVQRNDLDITTTGEAVIRKVIAGTNVTLSSTGVDSGTGDVTINASGGGSGPFDYGKSFAAINGYAMP